MELAIGIICVVVSLLLAASGFDCFVYFPRWLMHRYELNEKRKMVAGFAVAGLLVSVIFTGKYLVTRTEIITEAVFLWPTALILMDLDGHPFHFGRYREFWFCDPQQCWVVCLARSDRSQDAPKVLIRALED